MTRAEAIAAGSTRYHGSPCKACGNTERYTAHCECYVCARDRSARDYKKHIEKRRVVRAAYRSEYREEARVRAAKWAVDNRDAARERASKWHRENRDRSCAKRAKRRAALLCRTPAWADLDAIARIYVESKRLTEVTGIKHHVDHIIPLQGATVSGLHIAENLQILTAQENLQKSNNMV
jgi:hypothetical protein